jgi:hypothetical protein
VEAKFRDERGREVGEFEAELSRIAKEQADYSLDRLCASPEPLELGIAGERHDESRPSEIGSLDTDPATMSFDQRLRE